MRRMGKKRKAFSRGVPNPEPQRSGKFALNARPLTAAGLHFSRICTKEYPPMNQGKFVLLLLVAGSLGIWGCAQSAGNGANAERIRALETKIARLEEDFKASITV